MSKAQLDTRSVSMLSSAHQVHAWHIRYMHGMYLVCHACCAMMLYRYNISIKPEQVYLSMGADPASSEEVLAPRPPPQPGN